MAKNRKLLRVGVPIKLSSLKSMLAAVEDDGEAVVTYYNRELIVEAPEASLLDKSDE